MQIEWEPSAELVRRLAPLAVILLVGGGLYWWMSAPSSADSLPTAALSSGARPIAADPVLVDVIGDVRRPGVVRLPRGSRVIDAVAAAGGLLTGHRAGINLARVLVDGEQLDVGASPGAVTWGAGASSTGGGKVNINTATAAALDALPGIGTVLAQRIIDYRTKHGPFAQLRDLLDVPGIGDAKYSNIADGITIA